MDGLVTARIYINMSDRREGGRVNINININININVNVNVVVTISGGKHGARICARSASEQGYC